MKKLTLSILFIFSSISVYSGGPILTHKDTVTQQEFENVYSDLKTKVADNYPSLTLTDDRNTTSLILDSVGVRGGGISFRQEGTTRGAIGVSGVMQGNSSSAIQIHSESSVYISASGDSSPHWTMNTDGSINQSSQPGFLVYPSGDLLNVTGNSVSYTLAFNTEISDQGSDYNTGTYTFTAPQSGQYMFCAVMNLTGLAGAGRLPIIAIVTSNRTYTNRYTDPSSTYTGIQPTFCVPCADMDANDTAYLTVQVPGGAQDVDVGGGTVQSFFSGSLIN